MFRNEREKWPSTEALSVVGFLIYLADEIWDLYGADLAERALEEAQAASHASPVPRDRSHPPSRTNDLPF